jgi:hypothetical protein
MTGVDAVIARGGIDATRMCVTGGSYGGYLTNWIIGNSDRFKAAASLFGIFSLITDFSNSENPNWDPGYLGKFWWEDHELYHAHSPARFVTQMKTPVLILHGDEDNNTFISNSKEMYQALRLLGRTVEFVRYPREGHGFREPNHQRDAFLRILSWFDRHAKSNGKKPRPTWRAGDTVSMKGRSLRVVGVETIGDYSGEKAKGQWVEVTFVVRLRDGERAFRLKLSDVRLALNQRRLRPSGIVAITLGEKILVRGPVHVQVANRDRSVNRALACSVAFDAPKQGGGGLFSMRGFPKIHVRVPVEDGGK